MRRQFAAVSFALTACACSQSKPTQPVVEEAADPFEIPRKFWGEYSDDLTKCGQPYDRRVKISWDTIQFWENRARMSSIVRISPSSVSVTTENRGEGQTWTENYVLALSEDGKTLEITSPQKDYGDTQHSITRFKCPD